jgi:serine phosphatase RsbU (regulator of sigma subunit)
MSEPVRDAASEVAALEREVVRQKRLVEASTVLHSTLDQDELLGILLRTAADAVDAERGTVYLMSSDGAEIWSRVASGGQKLEIRLPLGKGIAGAVARSGETIRIDDAYADPRFDPTTDRRTGFRTRSILCAPIRNRAGAVVGVFQLLNRRDGPFAPADVDFLASLSVHAALAIENARLHKEALEKERQSREIQVAQGIQRALQPAARTLEAGPFDIAGMNELCEDASGDYYDFLEGESGRYVVAVGDVSGHGLGSALVMSEARALLRAFSRTVPDLATAITMLNDFLVQDMTQGKFMTFFAAVLDPATRVMQWCSAGHNPPMLWRAATGTFLGLDSTGPVLGILPGLPYERGEDVVIGPGDVLVLYTDGVTEAPAAGSELFGEERLQQAIRAALAGTAAEILASIRGAVAQWTGGSANRDDITMVCVKG